jgi:hypothetical protein
MAGTMIASLVGVAMARMFPLPEFCRDRILDEIADDYIQHSIRFGVAAR